MGREIPVLEDVIRKCDIDDDQSHKPPVCETMLRMIENAILERPVRAIGQSFRTPGRRLLHVIGTVAALALTIAPGVAHADAPEAAASAGCGAQAAAPQRSTLRFDALGRTGTYIQDVPPAADRPLPVVLDLHGYIEPALIAHESTGVGDYGTTHGFVTITPQLDEPGLPRWDFQPASADIGYLSELLTHVESTLCLDQRRVYVTGLSMGAFTTSSLGCQLSDRIAAIAPVAGLQDFSWCQTTRPVPVIAFHGTADPIVAYTGGTGPNARLLPAPDGDGSVVQEGKPNTNGPGAQSIPANAAAWAHRNGCGPEPQRTQVAPDVELQNYPCPANASVQLYSIINGGHVWPGSPLPFPEPLVGVNTTSIKATEVIWDFFRTHPLP